MQKFAYYGLAFIHTTAQRWNCFIVLFIILYRSLHLSIRISKGDAIHILFIALYTAFITYRKKESKKKKREKTIQNDLCIYTVKWVEGFKWVGCRGVPVVVSRRIGAVANTSNNCTISLPFWILKWRYYSISNMILLICPIFVSVLKKKKKTTQKIIWEGIISSISKHTNKYLKIILSNCVSIDVYRISYSMNYVYRAEKSNKSHWFVLHRRAELMCDEHHPLSIKRRHSQCPKVNRHDTRNDRERLVIVESIHHLTGDERDDSFLHATCIIWRSSFPIVLLLYTRERERTK